MFLEIDFGQSGTHNSNIQLRPTSGKGFQV